MIGSSFLASRSRILEACHSLHEGIYFLQHAYIYIPTKRLHTCFIQCWKEVSNFVQTCERCQTANDAKSVKEAAPVPVIQEV